MQEENSPTPPPQKTPTALYCKVNQEIAWRSGQWISQRVNLKSNSSVLFYKSNACSEPSQFSIVKAQLQVEILSSLLGFTPRHFFLLFSTVRPCNMAPT